MTKIKKIVCCEKYSLLLDDNGNVYECKSKQQNEESTESKDDDMGTHFTAMQIDPKHFNNERITNIECGWIHNIAQSESHNVYVWGSNLYHSCLPTEESFIEYPSLISHFVSPMINVKTIDCGLWHSCVLTDMGDVYVWGLNKFGQLGTGKDITHSKVPLLVAFGENDNDQDVECISMSSGGSHICIIDSNHCLWGWGYNKFNQIVSNKEEIIWKPLPIETKEKVDTVRCGHWFTCYNSKA